jgi:hypothetical protein
MARSLVGLHDHAPQALDHRAVMHRTVDFGDDRLLPRMSSLEQLDDARQAAGDVLGLGRGARDLGDDVAGVNLHAESPHSTRRRNVAAICFEEAWIIFQAYRRSYNDP